MDILTELYYGNVNPVSVNIVQTEEYDESIEAILFCERELAKLLSGRAKELFDNYVSEQDLIIMYTSADRFVAGFRLGTQIFIDATR